jgi:hypothetical protein
MPVYMINFIRTILKNCHLKIEPDADLRAVFIHIINETIAARFVIIVIHGNDPVSYTQLQKPAGPKSDIRLKLPGKLGTHSKSPDIRPQR